MKDGTNEKWGNLPRLWVALWAMSTILLTAQSAMAQGGSVAASETTIPGGTLVLIAYLILWVIFGGVLGFSIWRQWKLQEEIQGLESRIDRLLGTEEERSSQ